MSAPIPMSLQTILHVSLLIVLSVLPQFAHAAAVPESFGYQGRLLQSGAPALGAHDFVFCIYDGADAASSTQLACESHYAVPVVDGVFAVTLQFGVVGYDAARWLRVQVREDGAGAFTTLAPLQALQATPTSLHALDASKLGGLDPSAYATSGHAHAVLAAGAGLDGADYDGTGASTLSVDFGAGAQQVAPGAATASIEAGAGLGGGLADDAIGDGIAGRFDILAGEGITVDADGVHVAVDGTSIGLNASNQLTLVGGGGFDFVAVVSPTGGDYPDPAAAMADKANWCDQSAGTRRCLLSIQPGTWFLTASLALDPLIDIRGSSRDGIVLARTGIPTGGSVLDGSACGGNGCRVSGLTVYGEGDDFAEYHSAIYSNNGRLRLMDMVVVALQQKPYGIHLESAGADIDDVIVQWSGGNGAGIFVDGGGRLELDDCRIGGFDGGNGNALRVEGGRAVTRNCVFDPTLAGSETASAVRIVDGGLEDDGSVFRAGGNAPDGVLFERCAFGESRLVGSRITLSGADVAPMTGIGVRDCTAPVRLHDVVVDINSTDSAEAS